MLKSLVHLIILINFGAPSLAQGPSNNSINVIDGEKSPSEYTNIVEKQTTTIIIHNPRGVIEPAVEKAIAEWANPQVVLVEPGKSLENTIEEKCPGVSSSYYEILNDEFVVLGPVYPEFERQTSNSPKDTVAWPTFFLAPECVGRKLEEFQVEKNDSLWKIHKELYNSSYGKSTDGGWEEFKKDFSKVNGVSDDPMLEVGDTYLIPPSSFTLTVSSDRERILLDTITKHFGVDSVDVVEGSASYGSSQQIGSMDEKCKPNDLNSIMEFNVPIYEGVLRAFMMNRIKKRQIFDGPDAPVHIAVLDSGIRPTSHPLTRAFSNPITSAYGQERADFGSPMNKVYALRRPVSKDGEDEFSGDNHAEAVIGAALGGFFGAFYNSFNHTIVVHSHNIFDYSTARSSDGSNTAVISVLADRLEYGRAISSINRNSEVSIVNLSQTWTSDYPDDPLRAFSMEGKALIVAAAGNSGEKVDAGDKNYPSVYGGNEDSSIIVVGAINSDGDLMSQSSYHSELVDIGALGCNVPTLTFSASDNKMTMGFETGSSLAAPNVTFVAGLIDYLSGEQLEPKDIKKRIIYSSDIRPSLFDKFKDGRVLNGEKAVNIYFDLAEVTDSPSLMIGNIGFSGVSGGQIEICSGEIVNVEDVKKIAKVSVGGEQKFYIYLNRDGDMFKSITCDSIPDLEFTDQEGLTSKIEPERLLDIVFHM